MKDESAFSNSSRPWWEADGYDRDGTPYIRTLQGERVKSLEECVIADWLFYNGVTYDYERRYEFDTATDTHRQYRPKFYYPDAGLYHEHFALDANGQRPRGNAPAGIQEESGEMTAVHASISDENDFEAVKSPLLPQVDLPTLTPRELEALRWTMEGKTAWEVGAILGISERTAVLHVNNAMHKLGCTSKHQAVLRALRLGLIS